MIPKYRDTCSVFPSYGFPRKLFTPKIYPPRLVETIETLDPRGTVVNSLEEGLLLKFTYDVFQTANPRRVCKCWYQQSQRFLVPLSLDCSCLCRNVSAAAQLLRSEILCYFYKQRITSIYMEAHERFGSTYRNFLCKYILLYRFVCSCWFLLKTAK